jgi:hypothetical protein
MALVVGYVEHFGYKLVATGLQRGHLNVGRVIL